MSLGLYIHVPFCTVDCSYCHFARTSDHDADLRRRYVAGLRRELDLRLRACALLRGTGRRFDTVYLGGGTPSCLEPDLMAELWTGTVARLRRAADAEVTAEANPETFTPDVAAAWRRLGIGRVSLGVQSLDRRLLALLGRACAPDTARRALELACATFPRVAADWILGSGLRTDRLCEELDWAVDLGVEHVSLYILELHPGTALAAKVAAGRLRLPDDDEVAARYLAAASHLEQRGLRQYEVSNFARPGRESRHNRRYWQRRPFLGLGPGAHGHWARRRYANHATPSAWLDALAAGRLPEAAVDRLDLPARRLERIILGLRTREGIPAAWLPSGALDLARGEAEGLWIRRQGRFALTPRGFLHLDTVEERVAAGLDRRPGPPAGPAG